MWLQFIFILNTLLVKLLENPQNYLALHYSSPPPSPNSSNPKEILQANSKINPLHQFFLSNIYRHGPGATGSSSSSFPFHKFQVRNEDLPDEITIEAIQSGKTLKDKYNQDLPLYTIRPSQSCDFQQYFRSTSREDSSQSGSWPLDDQISDVRPFIMPDPTDKDTLINLLKMSINDYYHPNDTDNHIPVDPFSELDDFGWNNDGLRGYIYTNADKSIVIMSIKGTSTTIFSRNGTTALQDKYTDNRMFSCCCARVDFTWTPVCSCYRSGYNCSEYCLRATLQGDTTSYFYVAEKIAQDLLNTYPTSSIWFTGHSMGAAMAALLGARFYLQGVASVAFNAPGELLYAQRIGLVYSDYPIPSRSKLPDPYKLPIFHFYNDADPIPVGGCVGKLSTCYAGGYAMDSMCHMGLVGIYKTNAYLNDILYHRTDRVLAIMEKAATPPPVFPQDNCTDCPQWIFLNPQEDEGDEQTYYGQTRQNTFSVDNAIYV